VLDRDAGLENRLDEQAVLVDAESIDLGEPLPDGLDVADVVETGAERGVEPDRGRGLAGFLALEAGANVAGNPEPLRVRDR